MTIRDMAFPIEDLIPINTAIISVYHKIGLDILVPGLIEVNPNVKILSTGGSYKAIKELLGEDADRYLAEISQYTKFPEMEGGLVKTLHPKIHAGILGERQNPDHVRYLREDMNGGVFIDLVVVDLYPFEQVVQGIAEGRIDPNTKSPYNFETARGNIDIGGPTMLRAAAKNFPSCAPICDVQDYPEFLKQIRENDGATTFKQRLGLARKVFEATSRYDNAIAGYLAQPENGPDTVRKIYTFADRRGS